MTLPDYHRLNANNYPIWRATLSGYLRRHGVWEACDPKVSDSSTTAEEQSDALGVLAANIEQPILSLFPGHLDPRKLLEAIDAYFKAKLASDASQADTEVESVKLSEFESFTAYFDRLNALFAKMIEGGLRVEEPQKVRLALKGIDLAQFEGLKAMLRVQATRFDDLRNVLSPLAFTRPSASRAFEARSRPSRQTLPLGRAPVRSRPQLPRNVCHNCGGLHWRDLCEELENEKCPKCGIGSSDPSKCKFCIVNKPSAYSSGKSKQVTWVIDSGATVSMTPDESIIHDYQHVHGAKVEVANGETINVKGEGSVIIQQNTNTDLALPVQHVPDLESNLLSIASLTSESDTIVGFSGNHCLAINGEDVSIVGSRDGSGLYLVESQCRVRRDEDDVKKKCYISLNPDVKDIERVTLMELHEHLGHQSPEYLLRLVKQNLISGYVIIDETITDCCTCLASKSTRLRHSDAASRTTDRVGDIISVDLVGPLPVLSIHGQKFISHIIDHYSSFASVRCLKEKSANQVLDHVRDFVDFINQQKDAKVRILRSDGGYEFCNEKMESYLSKHGIVHETSAPYSPKDNGKIERRNRTMLEMTRCLLKDGNVSQRLWSEASQTACFLLNRTLTSNVPGVTPYEVIFGHQPDLKGLRKFGQGCFVYNEKYKTKLDDRAQVGIMVGYAGSPSIYRILIKGGTKVVESRNVRFVEDSENFQMDIDEFTSIKDDEPDIDFNMVLESPGFNAPGDVPSGGNSSGFLPQTSPNTSSMDIEGVQSTYDDGLHDYEDVDGPLPKYPYAQYDTGSISETEMRELYPFLYVEETASEEPTNLAEEPEQASKASQSLDELDLIEQDPFIPIASALEEGSADRGKSDDLTEPSNPEIASKSSNALDEISHREAETFQDITTEAATHSTANEMESSSQSLRRSTRSTRFQGSFVPQRPKFKRKLSVTIPKEEDLEPGVKEPRFEHNALVSKFISSKSSQMRDCNPTIHEALTGLEAEDWKAAIAKEIKSLEEKNTWTLTELPPGRKAIGSRFVLTKKLAAGLHKVQHKARLVAQGFSQIPNIDFFETFAPVTRMETVLLFLTIAANLGYEVKHVDFNSAYLNASLEEDIYMRQPKGYPLHTDRRLVLRLNKAIYGLKQAGREWYLLLSGTLTEMGWKSNPKDPCFFTRENGGTFEHLLVYVDDVLIAAPSIERADTIKDELSSHFAIKDLGPVSYFLGIKIESHKGERTFYLSQPDMINGIIQRYELSQQPPVTTAPILPSMSLAPHTETATEASRLRYASLVGSLLYISRCSRPDIAFAVGICTRFQSNPGPHHHALAERIALYLKSTIDTQLELGACHSLSLRAFSDADWAGDQVKYASTTGFIIYLGTSPILWCSKKQSCISLSTTEAEYVAMSDCTRWVVYFMEMLAFAMFQVPRPCLLSDSVSAIKLSENSYDCKGSRHIKVRYHFVRDQVERNQLTIEYVKSEDNIADGFTKALPMTAFKKWVKKMFPMSNLGEC